jgi:CheY-like chemotaxis protein
VELARCWPGRPAGSKREVIQLSRQARILLVDDRAENLVALEAILAPLGQVIVSVSSGEKALQALLEDEFAVVLLDVRMPGMDGFETAVQIKQHATACDVPIIFLTAAAAPPEQAFHGYAVGAVDYLAKPFDPSVLKAKVSVFVDLYLNRSQRGRSLLAQLSGSLEAIEEAVALLRGLPAVTGDAQAGETAARLAWRVGELRDALDGLQSP